MVCKPTTIEIRCKSNEVDIYMAKLRKNWNCSVIQAKRVSHKLYGDRDVPGNPGKLVVRFPSIAEMKRATTSLNLVKRGYVYVSDKSVQTKNELLTTEKINSMYTSDIWKDY